MGLNESECQGGWQMGPARGLLEGRTGSQHPPPLCKIHIWDVQFKPVWVWEAAVRQSTTRRLLSTMWNPPPPPLWYVRPAACSSSLRQSPWFDGRSISSIGVKFICSRNRANSCVGFIAMHIQVLPACFVASRPEHAFPHWHGFGLIEAEPTRPRPPVPRPIYGKSIAARLSLSAVQKPALMRYIPGIRSHVGVFKWIKRSPQSCEAMWHRYCCGSKLANFKDGYSVRVPVDLHPVCEVNTEAI